MTDFLPTNFANATADAGVTGVSPAEKGRPGTSPGRPGPPPAVLVIVRGILTGTTDGSWMESLRDWCAENAPWVRVVEAEYYELPLPRIAALRNPRRARELHAEVTRAAREVRVDFSAPVEVLCVTHSNGGVLALQMLRRPSMVWQATRWVSIAPALRRKSASREIGKMLRDGYLDEVTLVRPLADRPLAFAGRRRIATWPWGDLGLSGWDRRAMGDVPVGSARMIDLPEAGHSDPLRPGRRAQTFEEIVGPALGLVAPPAGRPPVEPEYFDGAAWEGDIA